MRRPEPRKARYTICASLALAACAACSASRPAAGIRTVMAERPLSIPVDVVTGPQAAAPATATLAIQKGSTDELPDGPASFDVDAAGALYIADPLRNRIAVYDAGARFQRAIATPFAADRVLWNAALSARDAATGDWYRIGPEGVAHAGAPEAADPAARLIDAQHASVPRPGKADLAIALEDPAARLASVRLLGIDPKGAAFVALETSEGSDTDNLKKHVRLYGAAGNLEARTADLPLAYYVQPNDELRVRNGVLYQLMPLEEAVRINVWRFQ